MIHVRAQENLNNNIVIKLITQASMQFFMAKSHVAMLLRSKFFSTVFDIHNEDRISQSFNIFIDCELYELNQMVQLTILNT